jgi:hypothetical protein
MFLKECDMGKHSRRRVRRQLPRGMVDVFGDRIHLDLLPATGEVPVAAYAYCEAGYGDFGDTCPLCIGPLAAGGNENRGSAEHVPPHAVGGIVRTRTCTNCNGRGSLAEADLVRWWANAYPASFKTAGPPGHRVGGDVLLRGTAEGKFALIVSGRAGDGVRDVLTTAGLKDRVDATFRLPTETWQVALLKSAYLAACVHLGEVPHTPDAVYARKVIRDGTFGPRGAVVGVGDDAVPFRVFRVYRADAEGTREMWIGFVVMPSVVGNVPIFGIGLGAVAFVTWPLPDIRQRALAVARRTSVA